MATVLAWHVHLKDLNSSEIDIHHGSHVIVQFTDGYLAFSEADYQQFRAAIIADGNVVIRDVEIAKLVTAPTRTGGVEFGNVQLGPNSEPVFASEGWQ